MFSERNPSKREVYPTPQRQLTKIHIDPQQLPTLLSGCANPVYPIIYIRRFLLKFQTVFRPSKCRRSWRRCRARAATTSTSARSGTRSPPSSPASSSLPDGGSPSTPRQQIMPTQGIIAVLQIIFHEEQ